MSEMMSAVIVDDDKLSAKVLEMLLHHEGMTVTTIYDSARIAETLADVPCPAVVFLDLEMPHLDGYEALVVLRRQFGSSLPIAAYSVHTGELKTALEKGFDGFFCKPVNSAAFADNLRQLLNGERVVAY